MTDEPIETVEPVSENVVPVADGGPWRRQQQKHGRWTTFKFVASELKMSPDAIRFWETAPNQEKIAQFEESILEHGIKHNITVYYEQNPEGLFTVEDGDTRYIAVRRLEGVDVLTGQPCERRVEPDTIIFPTTKVDVKPKTVRLVHKAVANSGRDFSDLEWAGLIHQLVTEGMPQQQIADDLSKPAAWVSRIYKLHRLPEKLRALLLNGQITTTTVLERLDEDGEDEAEALILEEIEARKGQAAEEIEELTAELRGAQDERNRLLASGDAGESGRDRRGLSPLETASRRVAKADAAVTRARKTAKDGPSRVTNRALNDRKQRKTKTAKETATAANTATDESFTQANYAALRNAVEFAAMNSREPKIRDAMNEALKHCGHDVVEPLVDDEGNNLVPEDNTNDEAVAY